MLPCRMSGGSLLMAPALCLMRFVRSIRTALGQYCLPDLCLGPGVGMVGRALRASVCACPQCALARACVLECSLDALDQLRVLGLWV